MKFHFTKHAQQKFVIVRSSGFQIIRNQVQQTIVSPIKVEDRLDGTYIATSIFDERHVLRVVYRYEDDIIVIITFYPGRRKAYKV